MNTYIPGSVQLNGGIFKERENVNRSYLLELDSQCLLQNFYLEAGIIMPNMQVINDPNNAKLHWGWESPLCQLRGHFLGHWLSASSKMIATYGDKELLIKLNYIIDELERCQNLNGGKWVGSIPEKYFKRLERTDYIWSPQYTMHKTCLGLMHSYIYAKNEKALKILNNLSDWYVEWTEYESKNCPRAIYSGEQGGMLEVWATMYEITKDEKYMTLANRYNANGEYAQLLDGKDALTNTHTNASIPLSHGACKMYQVTKDEKWLKIAVEFWKWAVTERGYFVTGGNNSGEFWIPPKMQGHFLNDRDQEYCTVYNMIRLAQYLFDFTGKKEYADYIELNLYNGFLTQQNRFTGMPTYFLPMRAGGKKVWGSKRNDFWCCHGTMIQSPTILPELIYSCDDKMIYVNQYIPSTYKYSENLSITQSVDMKFYDTQSFFSQDEQGQSSRWNLKFDIRGNEKAAIAFRLPDWIKCSPIVKINDKTVSPKTENGYFILEENWNNNTVSINFTPKLYTVSCDDRPELIAVKEGPIVLAGLIDADYGLKLGENSIDSILVPQFEHIYSAFPWKQSTYETQNQDKNFTFIPFYEVMDEKYTIYFTKK